MAFRRDSYDNSFSRRSTSGFRLPAIWQMYKGELLFLLALIIALILGGFTTHPGMHLAGATVLMDLLVWRRLRKLTIPLAVLIVVLNIVALCVILVGHDPVELWFAGIYGIYAILLVFVRR